MERLACDTNVIARTSIGGKLSYVIKGDQLSSCYRRHIFESTPNARIERRKNGIFRQIPGRLYYDIPQYIPTLYHTPKHGLIRRAEGTGIVVEIYKPLAVRKIFPQPRV